MARTLGQLCFPSQLFSCALESPYNPSAFPCDGRCFATITSTEFPVLSCCSSFDAMAATIDLNNIVFYNPRSEPQQPPRPPRPFRPSNPFRPFKPGAQSQSSSISSPSRPVLPAFPTPPPPMAGCHAAAAANQQRPESTEPPSNDFDRLLRALEVVETIDLTREDSPVDQDTGCFDVRLLDHQRPCLRGLLLAPILFPCLSCCRSDTQFFNAEDCETGHRSPCASESCSPYDSDPATPPNVPGIPDTQNKPSNSPGPGHDTTERDIVICQSKPMHGASDLQILDSHASDREISPMSAPRPASDKEPEHEDNCECSSDTDSLPEQQEPSPPPVLVERNGVAAPEWLVDGIINSRTVVGRGGRVRLEYLVDWTGYTPSWQPRHDLIPGCEELVDEFHKRYPNRPSPGDLDGSRRPKRQGWQPSGHRRKRVRLGI